MKKIPSGKHLIIIPSILFVFSVFKHNCYSQEVPYRPISYRIFNQEIINPAVIGSRKNTAISFISSFNRHSDTQILSGYSRLGTNAEDYTSLENINYSGFGFGSYLFSDIRDSIRYYGLGSSASFHMHLSRDGIQNIAAGITLKGIYEKDQAVLNETDSVNSKNRFSPNLNLGLYYYGAHLTAGISVINLISDGFSSDSSITGYKISPQIFFTSGYKFILSKKYELIMEPFIIANTSNTEKNTLKNILHPGFKVYYKHSYLGTYINDYENFSFFMNLQLYKVFIGTYIEFPWNGNIAWHYNKMTIEFNFGINISDLKTGRNIPDKSTYF